MPPRAIDATRRPKKDAVGSVPYSPGQLAKSCAAAAGAAAASSVAMEKM